jgi:Alpha/beta hydrolase domain
VLGGLRTPAVDAPAETLTGGGNSGSSPVCFLLGTATPLSAMRLATLYPLHSDYTAAVESSAAAGVAAGFLLPADALAIDLDAAGATTGLPAPTG